MGYFAAVAGRSALARPIATEASPVWTISVKQPNLSSDAVAAPSAASDEVNSPGDRATAPIGRVDYHSLQSADVERHRPHVTSPAEALQPLAGQPGVARRRGRVAPSVEQTRSVDTSQPVPAPFPAAHPATMARPQAAMSPQQPRVVRIPGNRAPSSVARRRPDAVKRWLRASPDLVGGQDSPDTTTVNIDRVIVEAPSEAQRTQEPRPRPEPQGFVDYESIRRR
jgi:hypothetical protein